MFRYLPHFFRSNIKYNKVELLISYGISVGIILIFTLFEVKKENTDLLVSIAFYATLYAFFNNKKKFNLKFLMSLPMSKTELVLTKCLSELIYFVPSVMLTLTAVIRYDLGLNPIGVVIVFIQISLYITLVLFDSDVEQPRLENTKSSFLNKVIYIRKWVDFGFSSAIVIAAGAAVYSTPITLLLKNYIMIIVLTFVLFWRFRKTLKLLTDESQSYFIFKRDIFAIGWKSLFVSLPAIMAFYATFNISGIYSKPLFAFIKEKKNSMLNEEIKRKENKRFLSKALLYSVESKNVEAFKLIRKNIDPKIYKKQIPSIILQATTSNSIDVVNLLQDKYKDHFLIEATKVCNAQLIDYLLDKKANPYFESPQKMSVIDTAVTNSCISGIMILKEKGYGFDKQNSQGFYTLAYAKNKNMKYLISKDLKPEIRKIAEKQIVKTKKRSIASKKLAKTMILNYLKERQKD